MKKPTVFKVLIALSSVLLGQEKATVGLISIDRDNVYPGYSLFTPMGQKETFLIDNNGQLINQWSSEFNAGFTAYLDAQGDLYRAGVFVPEGGFDAPGGGGVIQKFDWDNNLLWQFIYSDSQNRHHHDFEVMPNGNVLIIGWEVFSDEKSVVNGRQPETFNEGVLYVDHVIEVKPNGSSGGDVVWKWSVGDHLVQDFDNTKDNFGVVSSHPELIDINYFTSVRKSWNHINHIDYDPMKDLILLSAHAYSEVWIIDHSTTAEEANSHSGGNYDKGGDLIYRWGNPQAYKSGNEDDRKLFSQHYARWIPDGLPNAGKILLFNNGEFRTSDYSTINLLDPGTFSFDENLLFEPATFEYEFAAEPKEDFFSLRFSSAQQLANGNILVCEGAKGNFFEINPETNEQVWNYKNPVNPVLTFKQGENPVGNTAFFVRKYDLNYEGFRGKDLSPQGTIEDKNSNSEIPLSFDKQDQLFHLYPNPTEDLLNIKIGDSYHSINCIEIFDLSGSRIYIKKNVSNNVQFDVSNWRSGIYIVKIDGRTRKLSVN